MKRSEKMRKQISKVTTTVLEAQERSVRAEETLARLEDRDRRREARNLADTRPGRR
jgi:hypothetical protein